MKFVIFSYGRYVAFKREYERRLEAGWKDPDIFTYQGDLYQMLFAKYLIEYLERKFNITPDFPETLPSPHDMP